MNIVYITCALLTITIVSFARSDTVILQDINKFVSQPTTTKNLPLSVPLDSTVITDKDVTTAVPPLNITIPASISNYPDASTSAGNNSRPNASDSTTAQPTQPTQKSSTTASPAPTPGEPTSTVVTSTTTNSTTTNAPTPSGNSTTVPPSNSTTAVPWTTVSPTDSPPKDHSFDMKSFLGGIVFASCIMVAVAFAWKFCKVLNRRNYGTL